MTVVVGIEFLFFEFFFCFWFFMENSFNLADVGNKKILLILIRKMQKNIPSDMAMSFYRDLNPLQYIKMLTAISNGYNDNSI